MFNLGMSEIVVILVVALVFLGPKKLPELASGLGKMIRELRKATADIKSGIELDETIRKPVEELREAMTLHPEELKRRDLEKAMREAREKAEQEEEARRVAEEAKAADEAKAAEIPDPPRPAPVVEVPLSPRSSPAVPGASSSPALAAISDDDKTVAMPPPGFPSSLPRPPSGAAIPVSIPQVPGTVSRPTIIGMPQNPALPRPAPPPMPAAAKLPVPGGAARPIPAPPVKKE